MDGYRSKTTNSNGSGSIPLNPPIRNVPISLRKVMNNVDQSEENFIDNKVINMYSMIFYVFMLKTLITFLIMMSFWTFKNFMDECNLIG